MNEAIAASPSPNVVSLFDTLSNELCKVADLAEFIRLAHTDDSFAKAAEATSFEISGLVEKLNTHYELYIALRNAAEHGKNVGMDPVTDHVADLFLFDFEQSGIHLDKRRRKLATALHEVILYTGAQFTQGASMPRRFPLSDWPRDLSVVHRVVDKSMIIVESDYSGSSNPRLREQCYKAFMASCPQQSELLENLLNYRQA